MSLTPEDVAALGALFDKKIEDAFASQPVPPENHGAPDPANAIESAPVYYVHLANGDVLESKDSASTHMDVDGVSVGVIGRYPKGE
jgi:hypothetical protein